MRKLFHNFFSYRTLFYGLFEGASENIVEMAELFAIAVGTSSIEEQENLFKQIKNLEEKGDQITHKVYLGLDRIYFTPLNRKDIHTLASTIDDVADNIYEAAGRMNIYHINKANTAIDKMVNYIKLSCIELQKLINGLAKIKDTEFILASCRVIKDYATQTRTIYYNALADLFANEHDAISLIKQRDILFSLDASVSKCKKVTDTIEIIALNSI